jgi:FdhD protein
VSVRELTSAREVEHEDRLATEEPLEIRLAWPGVPAHRVWVTMRTPGHDFELAAGWLVHEGIAAPGSIREVAYCVDAELQPEEEFNVVTVALSAPPARDPGHRHTGQSSGSSACGVCGKDSVAQALDVPRGDPWPGPHPAPEVVRRLPGLLRERQQVFGRTGGVLAGLSPAEACLVVSGRAGFELVQKAVAAGVGALVAVGAPSSLAVRLAQRRGLHLYGFTSEERCVRYP